MAANVYNAERETLAAQVTLILEPEHLEAMIKKKNELILPLIKDKHFHY